MPNCSDRLVLQNFYAIITFTIFYDVYYLYLHVIMRKHSQRWSKVQKSPKKRKKFHENILKIFYKLLSSKRPLIFFIKQYFSIKAI